MSLSINLQRGIEAYKKKSYEEAERFLIAAMGDYPPVDQTRRTIVIHLGMVYRRTAQYEAAIEMLEQGLPFPGAFSELVSIYRFLGKVARKERDRATELENYQRMFSLSNIFATVMTYRLPISPNAVDWDRGVKFIQSLKKTHGTIYPFKFQGRRIEGDTLLNNADYRSLEGNQ
jgi:hypothetical protein